MVLQDSIWIGAVVQELDGGFSAILGTSGDKGPNATKHGGVNSLGIVEESANDLLETIQTNWIKWSGGRALSVNLGCVCAWIGRVSVSWVCLCLGRPCW